MKKWIVRIIGLVLFIVCLALVIHGQRTLGAGYLLEMLAGLVGILIMLGIYNKQHQ